MPTFYNQATLSYNGITTTSNITTGQLVDVLTVLKNALTLSYTSGQNIIYMISLINTGTLPLTNLTVTDNLGSYSFGTLTLVPLTYVSGSLQYYINGVLQEQPTITAEAPLTMTGISVPAGGNGMLIFETTANSFAPPDTGSTITNTATASGAGLTNPISAENNISVSPDPNLSISKSLSPTTVTENGQVTYTFVIENTGNAQAAAAAGVVVTDTFDPALNPIAVTLDGSTLALGTGYNYNSSTGAFSTISGVITVPPATFTQDAATGAWSMVPGTAVLVVTGTV